MKKDEILTKLAAGDLDIQRASKLLDELDIVNRKRMEDDLAKHQAMLQATIDSLPFDFFALGLDGRYVLQNAVSKVHWGDVLGKTPQHICSDSKNLALWLENNQRAFNGETVEEDVTMTNQGEIRYYHNRITPIRSRGTLYGILGVNIDITERKRAEEILREANNELERKVQERTAELQESYVAVRQSEQRFRSYYEQGLMGMAISTGGTNWTDVNDRFCEIIGYSREEISQRKRSDFIHPDETESAHKDYHRLRTGETDHYTADRRYIRKDGKVIYLTVFLKVFRSKEGTVDNVLGLFDDITERKQAEEALRQSRDQLQAIYDGMSDGLLIADVETKRFVRANASMCKMLGYTETELLTKSVKDIHPLEALPFVVEQFQALAEGRIRLSEDVPMLRKDGGVFHAVVSSSTFQYNNRRCVAGFFRDITARKQAEEALQKNENRFRSYFEQGLMGMAVSTDYEVWLEVNDRFCEILGYSKEEVLQRKRMDFIHPDDLESARRSYNRLLTGETDHYTAERRLIRKDGEVIYVTIFLKVFRSEEGVLDHILTLFDDITERKIAQDALAESEAKYRRLVETTDTGYLILDEEGTVVDANEEYVRMTGRRSLTEIMGRQVMEWTAPHDVEHNAEEVKKCLQTGSVRLLEVDYIGLDGKVVPVEINAKVIDTTQGKRIISLCRDITERRQTEAALRQSHDELQAINDTMVDGLLIGDCATKRLLRTNPAICQMLGYSHEELLSMTVSDIHPHEVVPGVLEMFETRKEGQTLVAENRPMLRKDGTVFYADIGNAPIIYQGQPCIIGIFRDTTERRKSQEALHREHRTLKHLLQSSDHERQTIAYEIHDGLAQYLAGAIMQFEVYKHSIEKKPNEAAKVYETAMSLLSQGHSEARRLIAGIRHPVLDEAGVIEAVAHLINEQNREKGPKIEFHGLVDFSRLVPLLENAIYRIIQEGMTNACKYSQSSRVRITLLQQKDRLRIEIRDWGIGFNTKDIKEGSYGLTGIRERARLLGGKYRLQSAAGKGTRIVVELPLMEREE